MKKINLAICLLSLVSVTAFADIPPQPGSRVETKIEDRAAQILFDSMKDVEEKKVPAKYVVQTSCGKFEEGKIKITDLGESQSVTIVCLAYYCRGHRAVCMLEEQF